MRKTKRKRKYYWYKEDKQVKDYQDLLLSVSRKRYQLILSETAELGATSCVDKTVEINPIFMICPRKKAQRQQIRHCPSNRDKFEQLMTTGLIYHEAAHIRFSKNKPPEKLLGWLWNTLEDRRIERLLTTSYPHFQDALEFLNDTVWYYTQETEDILGGCLLWGWECHLPTHQRKFKPHPQQLQLWEKQIKPLVEKSWMADDSDNVTTIAIEILRLLGIDDFEQPLNQLPLQFWQAPEGDKSNDEVIDDDELKDLSLSLINFLKRLDNNSSNLLGNNVDSDDNNDDKNNPDDDLQSFDTNSDLILARVEGYARDLATVLKPLIPKTIKRPHQSRGVLNLERALDGHQRMFDYKQAPASARSVAILTLIDQSSSMEGKRIQEAIAATMLLDRASEIAGVTFGVYGFENIKKPIIHRQLDKGNHHLYRDKIAGINVNGYTYLSAVFAEATNHLLARNEQIKILVIFHDGELSNNDAIAVKQQVNRLSKIDRFLIQPIFIGDDEKAVEKNKDIFGHVLHCHQVEELNQLLRVWFRALLMK